MAELIPDVSEETFQKILQSLESPGCGGPLNHDIFHEFNICKLKYHLLLQEFTHLGDTHPDWEKTRDGINVLEDTIDSLRLENGILKTRIAALNRELGAPGALPVQPLPNAFMYSAEAIGSLTSQYEAQFTPRFSHHSRALYRLWELHLEEAHLKRIAFETPFERQDYSGQ